jgi:UDP:flavonoid glycosyltransferase YjiC (YdhE family)
VTVPGRFLIVSWDGGGNVPPALNLGARLVQQGHAVRLIGSQSMAARATATGVEFATYPSVPPLPTGIPLEDMWEERVLPALHGGGATHDDIVTTASEFNPDVLVIDCMMNAGFDAVRTLGLPSAVLMHLLYSFFTQPWGDETAPTARARHLDDCDEVLALVPPGFDAPCSLPANTSYVGPITAPQPRPPLNRHDAAKLAEPGDPWVLLSLSTTLQGQASALPAMLEAVGALPARVLLTLGGVLQMLEAVGALPARVLLTLGGVLHRNSIDAPPNVTVREFVPHDLVLPYMEAVISHGGLSTITAALTAGVPLLCIPQGRDQHYNAERVEATGVGRTVPTCAPAGEIATALTELLTDPAARREARLRRWHRSTREPTAGDREDYRSQTTRNGWTLSALRSRCEWSSRRQRRALHKSPGTRQDGYPSRAALSHRPAYWASANDALVRSRPRPSLDGEFARKLGGRELG